MKIRLNKTDEAYFWFVTCYQYKFSFDDPHPYEHCNKLFNKWWNIDGNSISQGDYVEYAMDFLEKELNVWLEDLEAQWAVRNLLRPLNNE